MSNDDEEEGGCVRWCGSVLTRNEYTRKVKRLIVSGEASDDSSSSPEGMFSDKYAVPAEGLEAFFTAKPKARPKPKPHPPLEAPPKRLRTMEDWDGERLVW